MNQYSLRTVIFQLALFVALLILFFGLARFLSAPLDEEGQQEDQPEIKSIEYYLDSAHELDLEDLLNNPPVFGEITGSTTEFGHTDASIWLKIQAKNVNQTARSWILNTDNTIAHFAKIYQIPEKGSVQLLFDKQRAAINNLDYNTNQVAAKVTIEANTTSQIFIQYRSLLHTHMHIRFFNPSVATSKNQYEAIWLGLVIATLATLTFINLLFYAAFKQLYFLYYSLQEIAIILFFLSYGSHIKWPFLSPDSQPNALIILSMITPIFGILYTRHLLNTKKLTPQIDRCIKPLHCFMIVLTILSFVEYFRNPVFYFLSPLTVFLNVGIAIYIGTKSFLSGNRYALAYCLAWLSFSLLLIIHEASKKGFIHFDAIPHIMLLHIGFLLEGALLSLTTAIRVVNVRKQYHATQKTLLDIYGERIAEAKELQESAHARHLALEDQKNKTIQLASASHDINHHTFLMKLSLDELKHFAPESEAIPNIEEGLNYLQAITEDLIKVAKDELEIDIGEIDINEIFASLHTNLSQLSNQKGIQLRYQPTTVRLSGSKVLLKRILENIIRNAIQYTDKGRVLYGIRRRKTGYDICIYDTGSGIPATKLAQFREAFTRGEENANVGYGLGLFIASNLCQQSSYKLEIESTEGKGSVFIIRIPIV